MWSCRFHITSKTAWHENVAVQVFKIQRMQVFRPEIEPYFCCCYFKSFDRNLIFYKPIGVFLQLIVLKNFTGDARTTAETSAKARVLISPWKQPWHKKKKWSNHKRKPIRTFPFSCACFCACFNISSWKRNTNLKTKECSWAVLFYQPTKALVLGSFVVLPRWQRMKEVWRKGFRNGGSVPCYRFHYDTRSKLVLSCFCACLSSPPSSKFCGHIGLILLSTFLAFRSEYQFFSMFSRNKLFCSIW